MYLYFLPLESQSPGKARSTTAKEYNGASDSTLEEEADIVIPHPTHDGGIEHTAARFLPPNKWISLANQNRIILFPPQYFLTWHLAPFLSPTVTSPNSPIPSTAELQKERDRVLEFLRSEEGNAFGKAIISPVVLGKGDYGEKAQDGIGGVDKDTAVLRLDYPGPELEKEGVKGEITKWIVTTKFKKDGPRDVRVVEREKILGGAGRGKL